jgi:23S rRNA (pseudouridine1915-N3)-methyltransferase
VKIFFECFWGESGKVARKFFHFGECFALVEEYSSRITERGYQTQVVAGQLVRRPRSQLWLCHPRGKALSSMEVSERLQRAMSSGLDLVVAIGGDQGFSEERISKMKPDFLWSFGPMTLPHELAAVVATEQIYRAVSILRHEPYHRE